jgi:hypothetical protein
MSGRMAPLILALAALGCVPRPRQLDVSARQFMALVRAGDSAKAFALFEGADTIPSLREAFEGARTFLSPFLLDSARLIGWDVVQTTELRGELRYELHADSLNGLFGVYVVQKPAGNRVLGFRWQRTAATLASTNAFTFAHKTPAHLAFLALAILGVLFSLVGIALVLVARLRWWWALVALLGLAKFSINWTTGATGFQLLSIQLFSASALRPGLVGPWIVSFSLPVGAILVFLQWRRKGRSVTRDTAAGSAVI